MSCWLPETVLALLSRDSACQVPLFRVGGTEGRRRAHTRDRTLRTANRLRGSHIEEKRGMILRRLCSATSFTCPSISGENGT